MKKHVTAASTFAPGLIDPRDCNQKEKHIDLINASRSGVFTCIKCSLSSRHGFGLLDFVTDPDKPEVTIDDFFPPSSNIG